MISNVALQSTDASCAAPSAGATADTCADDALWFLGASLPALKVPVATVEAGSSAPAQIQSDNPAAGTSLAAIELGNTAKDLAQAFSFAGADNAAGDSKMPLPAIQAAATPAIDTTTWNSLNG